MHTDLFWVEGPWLGRMAISPRPRGEDWLDDEMIGWRKAGVDAVVSLLEPDEAEHLGLDRERRFSEANDMEFYSLPIADRNVPDSDADTERLLTVLEEALNRGNTIAIHCRQGIGRAGLIASALLRATRRVLNRLGASGFTSFVGQPILAAAAFQAAFAP
jgi:hypothetical protein